MINAVGQTGNSHAILILLLSAGGNRVATNKAGSAHNCLGQMHTGQVAPPERARRSATFDNGGAWARREQLRTQLSMKTCICDPHSPRQHGGRENANGMLRRDVPSHATLSGYSDADLDALLCSFNTTPRKCLGFRTPLEAFAQHLGAALEA